MEATSSTPTLTIVLVMLNNKQDYIMDNLTQLLRLGHTNIVVLTDAKFVGDFAAFKDNDALKVEAVETFYPAYPALLNKMQVNKTFRQGFWFLTSFRFAVLQTYMATRQLQNVVHIENDVLLYVNVQSDFTFHTYNKMLITMDTFHRAIPGFMFIPNASVLQTCLKHFKASDNDMQNWGRMFHITALNDIVDTLPIAPTDVTTLQKRFVTRYFEHYKAVFDAAALGQYLGGVDPSITPNGKSTIGFVNETCAVDYSKLPVIYKDKRPYLHVQGKDIPVICLHLHCKNLRAFLN